MSGAAPDPLDRILTRASGASSELYADVLVLLEVARAARDWHTTYHPDNGSYEREAGEWVPCPVCAALARLDNHD